MKRLISALTLTLMLSGLSAMAQQPPSNLTDRVVESGLMSRTANGDFREDAFLSRAELASILVRTFELNQRTPLRTNVQVQDVPQSHWAYNDIQTVLQNGVMTGYREGRFFPEQRVSRAEAFSIFAQAYGVFQFPDQTISEILGQYADATQIPAWAQKSMATALYEGFVNLDANNRINPTQPMTRADMAYALSVYLDRQQTPR
jgi:hypothetical protein